VDESFAALHPKVAAFCARELPLATPPQREGIHYLLARRSTLIASPTGTGKTLAAFLPFMSRLAERIDADELFPRPYVLYISPLRALGYDVEHNVRRPLREMGLLERPNSERAQIRRGRIRERFLRTGVRTSDTPTEERRLMLARPPHILLTTPESFALMLGMETYRKQLAYVEAVIVDEVHALAGNKRGSYLSLCLESLETIVRAPFVRVGLSATVAPLERVATFLVGTQRDCAIVDNRKLRSIRLGVVAPFAGAVATMPTIAQTAVDLGRDVRTQLVFTNVRSQAERLAHEMREIEGDDVEFARDDPRPRKTDARIGIHHSSLERSTRHRTEEALRRGDLHTVVCSSSLELGVDIGYIDRVCIVGGARGVASTVQRVGRAGHRPGAVADGVIIAQDRDDIIEAAATKRCLADGVIEETAIPEAPLDVLAQWLVQSAAPDRRIPIADALERARRAYPFRDVAEADLRRCVAYLSGGGAGPDAAHVRRIGADEDAIYGLGREVSSAFFENVGTIPDETAITVRAHGGNAIGKVEEGFVSSLAEGDVFLLSGKSYAVKEIRGGSVTVVPANARPNVPAWSSHIKGVPIVLAREIAHVRSGIAQRLREAGGGEAARWLEQQYGLEAAEAAHAVRYIAQQLALSDVAPEGSALIEVYAMDKRQTAIFHTCAGRRVNETLARIAGARVFRELRVNSHLSTDDNGFLISLPPGKRLPDAVWSRMLHARDFDRDLLDGLRASHLLRRHFRYVANTGLLVLRRAGGRSVGRSQQRWNSEKVFERLLEADPGFPLLRETLRVVTRDLLDAPAALAYLESLPSELRVLHPRAATPFSFGIVTSSFGDSVVMDDRASMLEALHEKVLTLLGEREGEEGALPLIQEIPA
jgi:ATP-dependent Lhr-like helicase